VLPVGLLENCWARRTLLMSLDNRKHRIANSLTRLGNSHMLSGRILSPAQDEVRRPDVVLPPS